MDIDNKVVVTRGQGSGEGQGGRGKKIKIISSIKNK